MLPDFFLDGQSLLNIIESKKQCTGHEGYAKLEGRTGDKYPPLE